MEDKSIDVFDWQRILFTYEIPLQYFLEIALRTTGMFLFLIIMLKFLSKRGVKQLSIFELAILIALGSATGDPMFYHDIPVLYGFTVLVVVILLYKIITFFTGKSKLFEKLLEGKPVCLLEDGAIKHESYKRVGLPMDKFFGELRLKSVDHLGQVRKVYLETSGELSVYLFSDDNVKPGLPIFPEDLNNPVIKVDQDGSYACITCGHIQRLTAQPQSTCVVCGEIKWLKPLSVKRISP